MSHRPGLRPAANRQVVPDLILGGVDLRFGPFSCIAGGNGVGKSNVFDAISFLGFLARQPLAEAAASVRDSTGRRGDAAGLFFTRGVERSPEMGLVATMLVAKEGRDELMQPVTASSTLLRYELRLRLREKETESGPIEILHESLDHVPKGEAASVMPFPHSAKRWREELVVAKRWTKNGYLRTDQDERGQRIVKIGQEGGAGRAQLRLAEPLPRTVLSTVTAANSPTGVLAQKEMAGWSVLQFEPTALRSPDGFHDPGRIAPDGAHVPATLHRLLGGSENAEDAEAVRQRVVNRLSGLVNNVKGLEVDRDERRELLTLVATLRDGTRLPARALSDGTLRFLALSVLDEASQDGLFCLEEPENGVFPDQIPAMLELLQDIAVDPEEPPDVDNPLRQVVVNTHSPSVVARVPDDCLILAKASAPADAEASGVRFFALPGTWRTTLASEQPMARADLTAYMDPLGDTPSERPDPGVTTPRRRVKDRDDLQMFLIGDATTAGAACSASATCC